MEHLVEFQELEVSSEKIFDEWKRLNSAVHETLHQLQKGTCDDTHDYQVDDEFQGVVSQRVLILNPRLLKPELMRKLSLCITRLDLIGAQIEVVFDYSNIADSSHDDLRGLLIAHAEGVHEAIFSLAQLRTYLGKWFYTDG